MDQFRQCLSEYLGDGDGRHRRWDELKRLLQLFTGRPLSQHESALAVFALLQVDTHLMDSHHSKAFEMADDLRADLLGIGRDVLSNMTEDLSSALALELLKHEGRQAYVEAQKSADHAIVVSRNWSFFLLRSEAEHVLYAYNFQQPGVSLQRTLEGWEADMVARGGYFPLCHEIADELRLGHTLKSSAPSVAA